jgi:hypothetical protein
MGMFDRIGMVLRHRVGQHRTPPLIDRLIVRHDVAARWGIPPIALAAMLGVFPVGVALLPVTLPNFALVLVAAVPVLMFVYLTALVARSIRILRRPFVTRRWLAAAHATFGSQTVTGAFQDLAVQHPREPDYVLRRGETIDTIGNRLFRAKRDRSAAGSVRMSELAAAA